MSWDVYVLQFSKECATYDDIAGADGPLPLGSCEQVRDIINRFFPAVDWSPGDWGNFGCDHGSIEFSVGHDEPVTLFSLKIRGAGEIVPMILAMCLSQRWQVFDGGNCTFVDKLPEPHAALERWAAYRQHVMASR